MTENEVSVQITDMDTFQSFLYNGDMKFLYLLMILMVVDVLTGLAKGFKNGNLWSRKSMYGIGRKMLIFCIIIVANILDQILNLNNGLLMVTVVFYMFNEMLSIVENCAEMNVLVPQQIRDKLKVMQENTKE